MIPRVCFPCAFRRCEWYPQVLLYSYKTNTFDRRFEYTCMGSPHRRILAYIGPVFSTMTLPCGDFLLFCHVAAASCSLDEIILSEYEYRFRR